MVCVWLLVRVCIYGVIGRRWFDCLCAYLGCLFARSCVCLFVCVWGPLMLECICLFAREFVRL